MELIHLWSALLFRKNYIWGLRQQILGEKLNDFLLNDKQSASQSCLETTELMASAGDVSFTVTSPVLTCFRRSSKFTDPSLPCYFCENMNLVASARYCSIYNSPAKSQLALISCESLLNNGKHCWAFTNCHWHHRMMLGVAYGKTLSNFMVRS